MSYMHFYACTELAGHGYPVLCSNNNAGTSGFMTDLDWKV